MQPSYPPLTIRISSSLTLALFIHSLHGAVFLFCFALPLSGGLISMALLLVTASWFVAAGSHIPGFGRSGVSVIEWLGDGRWMLSEGDGLPREARLLDGGFVSTRLIILRFRLGRFHRRSVILLPDNSDADQLRKLRIRLAAGHAVPGGTE